MSFIEIPTRSDITWYSQNVTLNGEIFILEIGWNTRNERWYYNIYDAAGDPLLMGQPLVVDYPLFDRYANQDLPNGELYAIDSTGEGREAGRDDLGDRVKLVFYDGS